MGSKTFAYTGGWASFDIPDKVTDFQIVMDGGSSGQVAGGRVTGLLRVGSKATKLWINVGQQGIANNGTHGGAATHGGGGAGGNGVTVAGGYSGGGASFIRLNTKDGTLRAVAGGAGGASGDHDWTPTYTPGPPVVDYRNVNGRGGRGGGTSAEHGFPGTSGGQHPTGYGNAVGGNQSQGGKGGVNAQGTKYDGGDAPNTALARAGHGGSGSGNRIYGGGGGGGGFRAGGGGQAGTSQTDPIVPAGGGAGGSSYVGGLIGGTNVLGGGGIGHGSVTINWVTPAPADQPPTPPTDIKLDNKAYTPGMATMRTTQVNLSATIDDPDQGDDVRLVVKLSKSSNFTNPATHVSKWYEQKDAAKKPNDAQKEVKPVRAEMTLTGLSSNIHYYARLYTQDRRKKKFSTRYTSINFYTDRPPLAPINLLPEDLSQFPNTQNVTFSWTPQDPDPNKSQRGFELWYRKAAAVGKPDNAWTKISYPENRTSSWTVEPKAFNSNNSYQWQVHTRDTSGLWGAWSDLQRFYITGPTTPPVLLHPIGNEHVTVTDGFEFSWQYKDPRGAEKQIKADIQYRAVGATTWIPMMGGQNPQTPGSNMHWMVPGGVFLPNVHYEWQARTYNTASSNSVSEWSDSGFFNAIPNPGSAVPDDDLFPEEGVLAPPLGCGNNRVYVYERGGQRLVGEIDPVTQLQWTRKRDDISSADIRTNGFGWDCGEMLKNLRCWQHEIVIFRDGVRVWEGPITRVGYFTDRVEIEAKDVMAYLYRRIIRNGYNDSYQLVNGVSVGSPSVVDRASQIALDALGYDNPNVIEYLTPMPTDRDAKTSRIVLPYSRTAWEEIDDLAATAGMDYTVAGRRILFWDTHEMIGLLPEMRDGDFSESPVVTEYGMNLCNYFAVTNGAGVWGAAKPAAVLDPTTGKMVSAFNSDGTPKFYGWVEQLASAYGESSGGATTTLTAQALKTLKTNLESQAKRNIANRWPSPLVVRVPDNATLNPEIGVGINQLIPGVWIPLRASGTLREIAQMQKLDSITVTQDSAGEKVAVVMAPAPRGTDDPDADAAAEADES